jgi:hypothetical protein
MVLEQRRLGLPDAATLADYVNAARRLRPAGWGDMICFVHESLHSQLGLGEHPRLPAGLERAEVLGGSGWVRVRSPGRERPVHLSFPAWSGDFAELPDAATLAEAACSFRDALGVAYMFSAAASIRSLISSTGWGMPPSQQTDPEPVAPAESLADLDSTWRYAWPGWRRPFSLDEGAYVRAFDRRGAWLSAWGGSLGDGAWRPLEGGWFRRDEPAPGYYGIPPHALPAPARRWPDPFVRRGVREELDRIWLTEPLVVLACELLGVDGLPAIGWIQSRAGRYLEPAQARIRNARRSLASEGIAGAAALDVLKVGYAGATAWFEWGPSPPHRWARPAWRRTIVDRFVANTFRSLRRASIPPIAVVNIDTALFLVDAPDAIPAGLPVDDRLGSWRASRALPARAAGAALAAGDLRRVLAMLEGGGP